MDVRAWVMGCLSGIRCTRVMMRQEHIAAFEAQVKAILDELGITEEDFYGRREEPHA